MISQGTNTKSITNQLNNGFCFLVFHFGLIGFYYDISVERKMFYNDTFVWKFQNNVDHGIDLWFTIWPNVIKQFIGLECGFDVMDNVPTDDEDDSMLIDCSDRPLLSQYSLLHQQNR